MTAWRTRTRAERTLRLMIRPARGTLAADADHYLALVAGMPTIQTRTTQIRAWVAALGPGRDRRDVTNDQLSLIHI